MGRFSEIVAGKVYISGGVDPRKADKRIGLRVINFAKRSYGESSRLVHFRIGDSWESAGRLLEAALMIKAEVDSGHRVLAHCHAGVNRSVTVVAIYLVIEGKAKDFEDALKKIKSVRPKARPKLEQQANDAIRIWEQFQKEKR